MKIKKEDILQAIARGWTHEENKGKVIDDKLIKSIFEEVEIIICDAYLEGINEGQNF